MSTSRPADAGRPVALVTGGSSGIGQAIALHLVRCGIDVACGARRVHRLREMEASAVDVPGTLAGYSLDVRSRESFAAFVDFAKQRFGRIDILVNSAGVMPLSTLNALKFEEWEWTIDVNVRGVLYGIAAVLPTMEAQGSGHVINLASIGAHRVWPGCAVYCASKYAVWAISEGLRLESPKVRVTTITPGPVQSELAGAITDDAMRKAMVDYRRDAIPAEAIARAVGFAIEQPADVDVNEIVVRPTAFLQ
jgi:NADP-dependent 3-hydroxy acid dehydrogenase YdfG